MKLTRLRLLGFKSFVEPTDFLIEPGLTGVVGPNGCGKSNLVEALRWVMGESSHKSMRAASMDEVIFSGSNTRPARNNAEVAIAIDNSTRAAPAAFNDQDSLEIARRIERDSGSVYRINGRDVRARDVQILFADASTGARSPALVHQGRIGEIIQAKPEQRRRVLEEAAGVAGLHARRHEAELRLKAAETNLLRVEDVIGQLAAQIDGLKKQARQAIRYRTVSSQVRKAEATLYHLRWTSANTEVAEAERAKDLCVRTVADRVGAEVEASKRQALAAASLPELREAEARAGAALHRLNLPLQDLDREETRAKDRIVELDLRLVQFAADTEREQRLAADAEQAIARVSSEEETIRTGARESAGRRGGVDAKVAEAAAALGATEKVFTDLTTELADLAAQRNRFENAAREQSERISRISSEIEAIERELKTLHTGDVGPLAVAMEGAQAALTEAEAAAVAAEAAHNVARAEMETARATLAESEKRVQRLETEAKTLSKMLSLETRSLWPPVIDHISVEKGYEKALGAALGDDLDAPVDPSSPMHWSEIAHEAGDPALPDGVETLAQFVKAPAQLARRLSQIGVVERDSAVRIAGSLKTGQRLVSREGDLWRWDGFVAAAHAPTGAARRLAQRSRFTEIDKELESARSEVDVNRRALETAQASFEAASSAPRSERESATSIGRLHGYRPWSKRVHALVRAETKQQQPRQELKILWSALLRQRTSKQSSRRYAMRSPRNVPDWRRFRPSCKRLFVKPNSPIAGSRPWWLTGQAGSNVSMVREIKSPRSNSALPKPGATARSCRTHHRFSPRNGGRLPLRSRLLKARGVNAPTGFRPPKWRWPRLIAMRGRRSKPPAPRVKNLRAPRNASRAPNVVSAISGAKSGTCWKLNRLPLQNWPKSVPPIHCRILQKSKRSLSACGGNVNGLVRSTSAQMRNCEKLRPNTPRSRRNATISLRRSRNYGSASKV